MQTPRRVHYACCISQRSARKYGMRACREPVELGTHVLERGLRHIIVLVVRCRVRVRARWHAVFEVSRVRLRDDVQRACSVFPLVLVRVRRRVRRSGGVVATAGWGGILGEERRVLEGREGGVEGAAERLGECAGVLGCCCADGGHVNGGGVGVNWGS